MSQQCQDNVSSASSSSSATPNEDMSDSGSRSRQQTSLFKLYEYQIVEMQHEYELLLEDKVSIDNQ